MKTKEDLRTDFHHVSGSTWLNSDDEPDIDYVEWLENQLLTLASAKEEVKLAETILHEWEEQNNIFYPHEMRWSSENLCKLINYASQFQSVQSNEKKEESPFLNDEEQQEIRNYYSGNKNSPKIINDSPIQSVKGDGERTDEIRHKLVAKAFEFEDSDGIKHSPWITLKDAIDIIESYRNPDSKDLYPKEKVIEFMWDAYKESNTVHEYESSLRAEFDEWVTTVI